jgi:carboxylate-amine ligase
MAPRFTLGIEEEFQIVDKKTGLLASKVHQVLEKGEPLLGEHIKAEMLQSAVEVVTDVCANLAAARLNLTHLRKTLTGILDELGMAAISAGTHPMSRWQDQDRTSNARYEELEEEYQDVGRSILIFGLHVHVAIDQHEHAIPLMNQLRTWLPHLLALSSNSPFWSGRFTGMRSHRSIVWKRFPRSGIPPLFSSTGEFDAYVQDLVRTGCIDNGKRIWWDLRPHPFFPTLEFRICDMPLTMEDTLAIAALSQALIAKLTWLLERNQMVRPLPGHYIDENKWKVARYGLDAEVADFWRQRRVTIREDLHQLLDFVDDVLDDLGTRHEINYLRSYLEDPRGTGADRQIALYKETGNLQDITRFLMQQTTHGLTPNHV